MKYIEHILEIKKQKDILEKEYPIFEEMREELQVLINTIEFLEENKIFITEESKKTIESKKVKCKKVECKIEEIVLKVEKQIYLAKKDGYDIAMESITSLSNLLKNIMKDEELTIKEFAIAVDLEEETIDALVSGFHIHYDKFNKIIEYFNLEEIKDIYSNSIYMV